MRIIIKKVTIKMRAALNKIIFCIVIFSFIVNNTAYAFDINSEIDTLRPISSLSAENFPDKIAFDLSQQPSAIRISDEPFDKAMHRERINMALKELLDTPDTMAFSPYAFNQKELYHIEFSPDSNVSKGVISFLQDKNFNLIVIDGMRKTFRQYGAPVDIIFHAGRGKDHKSRNIYIDKIDYDLLAELDKAFPFAINKPGLKIGYGSYILTKALEHELVHMNNPEWDEKKVTDHAPSAHIIEVFRLARIIDDMVFDSSSYNFDYVKERLKNFFNIADGIVDLEITLGIIKIRAELLLKKIANNQNLKLMVKGLVWDILSVFYISDREWFIQQEDNITKLKKGFLDGLLDVSGDDPLGIETLKNIFIWLGSEYNDEEYGNARDYILKFVEYNTEEDWRELRAAFYKKSEFGTAGRRSLMFTEHSLKRLGQRNGQPVCMPGPNRLNIWTARETALMVARYILKNANNKEVVSMENPKLVYIGYDVRYNSFVFAREIAKVMHKLGFETRLFNRSISISGLAWAVKEHNATVGFEITASHNPKNYNGIKVEGKGGGQISSDYAAAIISEVGYPSLAELEGIEQFRDIEKFVEIVDTDVFDEGYIGSLVEEGKFINDLASIKASEMKVMIDPLSGTGVHTVKKAVLKAGLSEENIIVVSEHYAEDSAFSGLDRPDPASRKAVLPAINKAKEYEADNPGQFIDAILLTDPDADRLSCIAKNLDGNWEIFSANRLWPLMAWVEAKMHMQRNKGKIPDKSWAGLVKSGITTKMLDLIAEKYNYDLRVTPTGFTFVGPELMKFKHGFGFEDSYGMGMAGHIPEKDATLAALKTIEIIAYARSQGLSLYQLLIEMYKDIGYYVSNLPTPYRESDKNFDDTPESYQAIRQAEKRIRHNPPLRIGKLTLNETRKPAESKLASIFKGVRIPYGEKLSISARPSGTEPMYKIYSENIVKLEIDESLSEQAYQRDIYDIMKSEDAYLYSITSQLLAGLFTDEMVSNCGLMLDIDGNLALRNKPIPQTSIDMLIYLMARGVRVAINSGRSFDESSGKFFHLHSLGIKERVVEGINERFDQLLFMKESENEKDIEYSHIILGHADSIYNIHQNLIIYANNSTQKYLFNRVSQAFEEDLLWQKGFIDPAHKKVIIDGIKIVLLEISNDPQVPDAVKELLRSDAPVIIDRSSRITFAFAKLEKMPDSVGIRSYIVKKLNKYLMSQDIPAEVSASGLTTIGINRIDVEKDTALRDFIATQNIAPENVIYIGDEFYAGGNDLPVLKVKGVTAINTNAVKAQPSQTVNVNGKVDAVLQILLLFADMHSQHIENLIETPFVVPAIAGLNSMYFKNTHEPVNFAEWKFMPSSMGKLLASKKDSKHMAYFTPEGFVVSSDEKQKTVKNSSPGYADNKEPRADIRFSPGINLSHLSDYDAEKLLADTLLNYAYTGTPAGITEINKESQAIVVYSDSLQQSPALQNVIRNSAGDSRKFYLVNKEEGISADAFLQSLNIDKAVFQRHVFNQNSLSADQLALNIAGFLHTNNIKQGRVFAGTEADISAWSKQGLIEALVMLLKDKRFEIISDYSQQHIEYIKTYHQALIAA